MNFRKMLEALVFYAKSDRAPELRETVQRLVNDEQARRRRTAVRLWMMREQHRNLLAKYVSIADVYTDGCGTPFPEIQRMDTEERRKAVQETRQ